MRRILASAASVALLCATAPAADIHQNLIVHTNKDIAVAGRPADYARISTSVRIASRDIQASFGSIHMVLAQSSGNRDLIVFCGGNGFREETQGASTLETLTASGDVLLFDYPGLGMSGGRGSKEDYQETIDAVAQNIQELHGKRYETVHFWGHSLGGGICATIAAKIPDKSTLTLMGAFPNDTEAAKAIIATHTKLSFLIGAHIADDAMDFDIPHILSHYAGHITVVASQSDETIPFTVSKKLAANLQAGGHQISFIPLQNVSHGALVAATEALDNKPRSTADKSIRTPVSGSCAPIAVLDGCGTLIWPNGARYSGQFQHGLLQGSGTLHLPDGVLQNLTYQQGDGTGQATQIKTDGTQISGPFTDCRRIVSHAATGDTQPTKTSFETYYIYALVTPEGRVTAPIIALPPHMSETDQVKILSATPNLAKWQFSPAKIGDTPVTGLTIITMNVAL